MNEIITYTIIALIFSLIGFFIGKILSKLNFEKEKTNVEKEKATLEERLALLQQSKDMVENNYIELQKEEKNNQLEKEELLTLNTRQDSEIKNLQLKLDEHKAEVEKLQKKFTNDFEVLANKILEEKSTKFTQQNKENIKNILNPLKEKIESFERKVSENQEKSTGMHSALKEQLNQIKDLNTQMSKEANNLTKALKGDNKMQGNWGEEILENVLNKSGLIKDIDYNVQKSFIDDEGVKHIPDVVINLPDGKKMIIDSKVSLTNYEKFSSSESKEEQKKFLKLHIDSLKSHIKILSEKKYENIFNSQSPDFILMFVPIEPALYFAQNTEKDFFYSAFKYNILLVSPTTLLSTLKTIDNLWKNERQQQNAREIAKHSASLYNKFVSLLNDLEIVGRRIKSSNDAYSSAMKKLTGQQNLIKDITKLEELGVSPQKKIEQKWITKSEENTIRRAKNED